MKPCGVRRYLIRVARNGRDLDVALAGQTLEIEIGQTKRHTKFGGKRALSGSAISIELAQEEEGLVDLVNP